MSATLNATFWNRSSQKRSIMGMGPLYWVASVYKSGLLKVRNHSAYLPSTRRCFFLGLTINLISILSVLGFPADFLWNLCAVASRRPPITSRPNKLKVICGSEYPISEPERSGPIRAAGSWREIGRGRRLLGPLGCFSLTPVTSVFNAWGERSPLKHRLPGVTLLFVWGGFRQLHFSDDIREANLKHPSQMMP